jgi:hypothetical protein
VQMSSSFIYHKFARLLLSGAVVVRSLLQPGGAVDPVALITSALGDSALVWHPSRSAGGHGHREAPAVGGDGGATIVGSAAAGGEGGGWAPRHDALLLCTTHTTPG